MRRNTPIFQEIGVCSIDEGETHMKIFAHRGSKGTHPENTIAAFEETARLPIDGVEFDVHLTKDGEMVVIHDETICRTSNGEGKVKDMTLLALRKYDFGSWFADEFAGEKIPTLQEVLAVFLRTNHEINIELKSDIYDYEELEEKVLSLIASLGIGDRVIISSFNHEALRKVKRLQPTIQTGAIFMETLVDPLPYVHNIPADAIHLCLPAAIRPVTKEIVEQQFPVRVFTVNEKEHILALKRIGVEAIFTDFPERTLQYINE